LEKVNIGCLPNLPEILRPSSACTPPRRWLVDSAPCQTHTPRSCVRTRLTGRYLPSPSTFPPGPSFPPSFPPRCRRCFPSFQPLVATAARVCRRRGRPGHRGRPSPPGRRCQPLPRLHANGRNWHSRSVMPIVRALRDVAARHAGAARACGSPRVHRPTPIGPTCAPTQGSVLRPSSHYADIPSHVPPGNRRTSQNAQQRS